MLNVNNEIKKAYDISTTQIDKIILDNKEYRISNVQYDDDCYEEGNIFGTAIARGLEFEIENLIDLENKEFEYITGLKIGDTIKWISLGNFITYEVEPNDTTNIAKISAIDYMLKSNVPYITELDYSSGNITMLMVLQEACNKAGIELATTDFVNKDFIVDSNQFDDGTLIKQVFQAVAQMSGTVAKIKNDNKLYLINPNSIKSVAKKFILNDYEEAEIKRETHPINIVSLGMTDIEGENITLRDENSILKNGENTLTINDNPFAYTQSKREQLIPALFDSVKGFEYKSYSFKCQSIFYLETMDKIQFVNKKGEIYDSYIFRFNYKSPNGLESTIEAPSIIKATVNYQNVPSALEIAKRTEYKVDKANQIITQTVEKVEDTANEALNNTITIDHVEKQKSVQIQASEGILQNVEIYGESTQETRSGKNILKGLSTPLTDKKYWLSYSAEFIPLTDGWGKFAYDNTNGTEVIFLNALPKLSAVDLKPSTEYTIVTEIKNSNVESGISFWITNNSRSAFTESTYLNPSSINAGGIFKNVISTKEDFTGITMALQTYLRLPVGSKGTVEARMSILEGNVDITNFEYEPYGAMPSTEFPSPIISVGSNINWYDKDGKINENVYNFLPRTSTQNGGVGGNAFQTLTNNIRCMIYCRLKENEEYTIHFPEKYVSHVLFDIEENGLITYQEPNSLTKNPFTFKTTTSIICCIIKKTDVTEFTDEEIEEVKNSIKIESGNVVTGYTDYNCGGVDYKVIGKNNFDLNKLYKSSGIVTNDTGFNMKNLWASTVMNNENFLKNFKPNTSYICTAKVKVISKPTNLDRYNTNAILLLYKANSGNNPEVLTSSQKNNWNVGETHELNIEFTTPTDLTGYNLIGYDYHGNDGGSDTALGEFEITDLMIREATIVDNAFELYKEFSTTIQLPAGVELCSLPNGVRDYTTSNGIIHKTTKKIIFDGTENWGYSSANSAFYTTDLANSVKKPQNNNSIIALSNYFKGETANNCVNSNYNNCIGFNTIGSLWLRYNEIDTVEALKNWLSENKPILIYELAEEDTTQTLEESEITKLQTLKTLNGVNNITITAETSFDYLTTSPLNDVYETKNNANRNYTTINKQYTEVKTTTEGVTTQITDITQSIENSTGEIETIKSDIYNLQQTTAGMEQTLTQQGGSNLLLNSSGLFDNEYWEGTINSLTNTDIQNNFIAKACFSLQNGTAKQSIKVVNGAYYVGFKYQKLIELANCKLKINDVEVNLTNTELTEVDKIINVSEHNITIELISNTTDACLVGDIIVVQGTKQSWSSNMNEIYTETVKIGIGLEIISNTIKTKLLANADGVRIVNTNNNEVVAEFTDMGMTTKEITANKGKIAGLLIQQVGNQVWLSNILGGS